MNTYAEKYNLLVLYPQQPSSANFNEVMPPLTNLSTSSAGIGSNLMTKKEEVENLN